jgi:hypothetical protein
LLTVISLRNRWTAMKKIPPEISREYARLLRLAFPERVTATRRAWEQLSHNRLKRRKSSNDWKLRNPEKVSAYDRARRTNDREKMRLKDQKWFAKRYHADPNFKLRHNLRSRLWASLNGKNKSIHTLTLLGCSIEDLWIYLESKFEIGMTRENYGKVWHVDHIMPCAIFDLSRPEHQRRCFHFSNLQPMLAAQNIRKRAHVKSNQFNLL